MKKLLYLIFAALMLLVPLSAGEITRESGGAPLPCGELLFINLQEPAQVYLDGKLQGITPLLLSGLKAGSHTLHMEESRTFHTISLNVNSDISELTTYIPLMEKYFGLLTLTTEPPNTDVWEDEVFLGTTPLTDLKLAIGKHRLKFYFPGYIMQVQEVSIARDTRGSLKVQLEPLYAVTLTPPLSAGMQLLCRNDSESQIFRAGEEVLLSAGHWHITLKGAGMVTATQEIDLMSDREVVFEPVYFDPYLVFTNLRPGSQIYIDYENVTSALQADKYMLNAGEHNLDVRLPAYLNDQQLINVLEDRATPVVIRYIKDPMIVSAQKKKVGWITFGIGAGLTLTSLILNTDALAVAISAEDYATYTLVKYSSLGGLGAGLLTIGIGLLIAY